MTDETCRECGRVDHAACMCWRGGHLPKPDNQPKLRTPFYCDRHAEPLTRLDAHEVESNVTSYGDGNNVTMRRVYATHCPTCGHEKEVELWTT